MTCPPRGTVAVEAAVFALTDHEIAPLAKGDGVLVVEQPDGGYRVEELD